MRVAPPEYSSFCKSQCHFLRLPLPMSDYVTDTKLVMDNAVRIIQAMIDVAADAGWLATALGCMNLVQMIMQARRVDDPSVMTLPKVTGVVASALESRGIRSVAQIAALAQLSPHELGGQRMDESGTPRAVRDLLVAAGLGREAAEEAAKVSSRLPLLAVMADLRGPGDLTGSSESSEAAASRSSSDLTVEIQLSRRGSPGRGGGGTGPRAFTPGFPKACLCCELCSPLCAWTFVSCG